MRLLFLVALVVFTLVAIAHLAMVLASRRRVGLQPAPTWLGRGKPPVGAILAAACIVLLATQVGRYPPASVALGIAWLALVGAGPLLAWLHGTWIHDEGVELGGFHFPWTGTARARLVQRRGDRWELEVDPGIPRAKPLTARVDAARVEAAREALARVDEARGIVDEAPAG